MAEKKSKSNCFEEFNNDAPRKKDPTIQVLFDYEKHYMDLVRKYSTEIKFIEDMLSDYRQEQIKFYTETLPELQKKLNEDPGVDEEMKRTWLCRLTANMDKSFQMSDTLINDFVTKKLQEFKDAVNEKLRGL